MAMVSVIVGDVGVAGLGQHRKGVAANIADAIGNKDVILAQDLTSSSTPYRRSARGKTRKLLSNPF